jgi:protein involved in polysaccharide export with SLBB domain
MDTYFNKRIFRFLLLITIVLISLPCIQAQDLLKNKDLSQVRVDQLSDADIAKLKAQLGSSGMTIDQAEQMAVSKGMTSGEFTKLKQRLAAGESNTAVGKLISKKDQSATRANNSADSLDTKEKVEKTKPLINPLIFGAELYTGIAPSFEPNLNLATPLNYVLGPNDQILVSVYGVQEYNGDLVVSPEGSVSIPNVGQVRVAGLTVEAASQKLKTVMGNSVYTYLKSGGSKLSVTLSKIRSIKVTIIGANRPGNFSLSSLSTVFNALFVSGGPAAFGSFREIELIRNNKLARKIDLYRFLLHGDQSDNVGLQDNDVIRIPAYKTRVELQGQFKRPGIFEVLPGETFANIVSFTSGFTDTAYTAAVKVYQRSDAERRVYDLWSAAFNNYVPQTGDVFVASKILNRFQNRVKITGAVFRPDVYELTSGLKVADLIKKADGLKEDAYTGRGQILRLEDDLTRSMVSFDIKKAMAGQETDNVALKREDEILISSVQDLRDSFKVFIQGEVRIPGQYDYVDQLTLKDLILQAGGFTDAAYKNIEIARVIRRDSVASTDNRASAIINTEINGDLSSTSANIPIQPFDVVTIRRKAGYTLPESVMVSGQVQYPGPYALVNRTERVSDILRRAGGYTPDANPAGAYVKRYKTEMERKHSEETALRLQKNAKDKDSVKTQQVLQDIKRDYDQIPLNMAVILKNPGSVEDLVLRYKDELYIPKFDGQVKISGAVLMATQVPFKERNSAGDYISDAGGYAADAWRRKTYIVYANGKAATTKHFFFIKFYPKILPGSELVVPKHPDRKGMTTGEIIGISSALASMAGVVIALLRL